MKNKLSGAFETFTPAEFAQGLAKDYRIVDASLKPTIEGAPYVDLTSVTGPLKDFGPEEKLLLICNKGKRAYLLQNRLKAFGYQQVKVLEGGNLFTDISLD